MKKLLLTILAAVAVVGMAKAESITINVNDATGITGTHVEEKAATDTSYGEAEKWQPLESLKLGEFRFEFSTTGSTSPAYYKTMSTNTSGQYTIRVYSGTTVTVTAPSRFSMAEVYFKGSNAGSGLSFTTSTGNMVLSSNNATWTGTASKFSFEVNATWRITEVTFSTEAGDTPDEPGDEPGDDDDSLLTFTKVTEMAAGKYAIVASGNAGDGALSYTKYGYIKGESVTDNNGTIKAPENCVYTFTATEGGYYIQDYTDRYLYMTGTYNSFNAADDLGDTDGGAVWSVTIASNGEATITNVAKQKTIQWATGYSSYGSYADIQYVLPTLYKLEAASVEVSAADAVLVPVEIYNLQGIRLTDTNNLPAGIYVRRQGNEVSKILVK